MLLARWLSSSPDEVALRLLRGHARLQAQAIASVAPHARPQKAKALSKELGYPVLLEPAKGGPEPRHEWRNGELFIVVAVPETPGQVAFGPIPRQHTMDFLWVIVLAAVLSAVLAYLQLRPFFRLTRDLESVAERMCAGDFQARAPQEPGEPLGAIGASLNQLAERIGQLLSDERDLLRSVAHEVRAPISRMHFRMEKIQRHASDATRKDAEGLAHDLEQVEQIFDELLTYVAFDEFDYERPSLETEPITMMAAVRRVVSEVTATDDAVHVTVGGDARVRAIANPKLFDRAVTNLLLNAMAYGGPDIRVEIRAFDQECVVDVQDSGPGIPESHRPKVIKPFVRLAKKKTRGTGLGLAIVSRIMRLHQGRLHLQDAPNGGASVQLVWKNADPRPKRRWRLR